MAVLNKVLNYLINKVIISLSNQSENEDCPKRQQQPSKFKDKYTFFQTRKCEFINSTIEHKENTNRPKNLNKTLIKSVNVQQKNLNFKINSLMKQILSLKCLRLQLMIKNNSD